jgi:predicted nucleic acid-binding protein
MLHGNLPEVFLDTDVSFDIISKREPHFSTSVKLIELTARDLISPMISEVSLANLVYLSFDIYKIKDAEVKLSEFIGACTLVSSGKQSILEALQSGLRDKEDAIQYYTALRSGADFLVTRNTKDYLVKDKQLPVLTPEAFVKQHGSSI